jgi:hypothetical protein
VRGNLEVCTAELHADAGLERTRRPQDAAPEPRTRGLPGPTGRGSGAARGLAGQAQKKAPGESPGLTEHSGRDRAGRARPANPCRWLHPGSRIAQGGIALAVRTAPESCPWTPLGVRGIGIHDSMVTTVHTQTVKRRLRGSLRCLLTLAPSDSLKPWLRNLLGQKPHEAGRRQWQA